MNDELGSFSEKYCKQSRFIQAEIEAAAKGHGTLVTSLVQDLKSIEKITKDGISERKTFLNDNTIQLNDDLTSDKNTILTELNENQKQHDLHLSQIDSLTKMCLINYEQQKIEWTKMHQFLMEAIREKDVMMKKFTDNLTTSLTNFTKDAGAIFDAEYKKVTNGITAQKSEIDAIKASFDVLQTCVTNMNGMLNKTNDNLMTIEDGTSKILNYKNSVDEKLSSCVEETNGFQKNYDAVSEKENILSGEIEILVSELQDKNRQSTETFQAETQKMHSLAKTSNEKTQTSVKDMMGRIDSTIKRQNSTLESLEMKTENHLKEKTSESEISVQKCHTCVTGVTTNCVSLHNCLSKNITSYESDTKAHILQISDATETFKRNEIKTYQSTGRTPAGKTYRIVKDLPATSPHASLITRFRLEHNNISDLNSSTVSDVSLIFFKLIKNLVN